MADFNVVGTEGPPSNPIGDERMHQGIGFPLRPVVASTVETFSLLATDDAGDGSPAGDVNATDFTGQPAGSGNPNTYATISNQAVANIVHKAVVYQYTGPRDVTIGVGGNYTVLPGDLVAQGTADHALLQNLTASDAHPMAAITGLLADQTRQDTNLSVHEGAADPHPQYTLETDALQVFSFAAYGAMYRATPGAGSDIGAAWQTVEFDATRTAIPRGIAQDTSANTMAITNGGVYAFAVTLGWEHDSSNQGRTTQLRLFNVTTGTPNADPITIGTGRNAEATAYSITTLFEITEAQKGDVFRLEIGGGDDYSSVIWNVSEWSIWNVGEWREPLPSD